jgi:hypothetical protein
MLLNPVSMSNVYSYFYYYYSYIVFLNNLILQYTFDDYYTMTHLQLNNIIYKINIFKNISIPRNS